MKALRTWTPSSNETNCALVRRATTSPIPPVRVVDVFADELDLVSLGFDDAIPAYTGRPAYHPAILLKIYIYGNLNRIQSSRHLEREAQILTDPGSLVWWCQRTLNLFGQLAFAEVTTMGLFLSLLVQQQIGGRTVEIGQGVVRLLG